jgi:hypothetical protein
MLNVQLSQLRVGEIELELNTAYSPKHVLCASELLTRPEIQSKLCPVTLQKIRIQAAQ